MRNQKRNMNLRKSLRMLEAGILTGVLMLSCQVPSSAEDASRAESPAGDEGKVLRIYCWNTELKSRMEAWYPGYEADPEDTTRGYIGDVSVQWVITPIADYEYENTLTKDLSKNFEAEEPIDLYLLDTDFARRFIISSSGCALTLEEMGISPEAVADQFEYTRKMVTDDEGNQRGIAWTVSPGVMIYNRQAAVDTWGTDEPEEIQKHVDTWQHFREAASELKDNGYYITASAYDTYLPNLCNRDLPWVSSEGVIQIAPHMEDWARNSRDMIDAGETNSYLLWSRDWTEGFYPEGKVFAYFGPDWMIRYQMEQSSSSSIAAAGGWAVTTGPESFFWGGSWICGALGNDNPSLVKEILTTLSSGTEFLQALADEGDFVNSRTIMQQVAESGARQEKVLSGQDPTPYLLAQAVSYELPELTVYDRGCSEFYEKSIRNYFEALYSYDEAADDFYIVTSLKYPSLTH